MSFKPKENQIGGSHYCEFDAWYFADKFNLSRYEMPAIKYLLRYHKKNGIQDLKKSIDYIKKRDSLKRSFIYKTKSSFFACMNFFGFLEFPTLAKKEVAFLDTLDESASIAIFLIITASKRHCKVDKSAIALIEELIKRS